MTYAYLDLNVFDRIEKKATLDEESCVVFSIIEKLIEDGRIICPYSNAHINDLLRGFAKNPVYMPKHLETIKRLTHDLSIVQYWGNAETTWHYRDIAEFFNSALEANRTKIKSFSELLDIGINGCKELLRNVLRSMPIPINFNQIYTANPIFDIMYPRTKKEMNWLAFCEDLYDFSLMLNKDYSLYKALKFFINQTKAMLPNQQEALKQLNIIDLTPPQYLNLDEAWEKYAPKTKTSANPAYQYITETYCIIDFKGFKSDDKFPNLIDDSLHVFYGAHCDYFVTLDDNCHYKATETYRRLEIATKVMKPNFFAKEILS